MAWGTLLALALAANAGGSAEETELGEQKSTGTRLFAKVVGDRLVLRSLGPTNIQAAYGIDLDADGKIAENDLYYTVQKDGTLCAGRWYPARKALECNRPSKATGSQETIGSQALRRLEIPLDEVAPTARVLRIMLMMNKPEGGNATAWASYDLVTGAVQGLGASPAATKPATATVPPAAKPTTAPPATPVSGPGDQALADRYDGGEVYNGRECKYRRLQNVRLHRNRFDGPTGEFQVRPLESDSVYNNELRYNVYPDGREKFRLVVSNAVHRPAKVTSAALVIGAASFPLRPIHPFDDISPVITYQPYVSFDELPAGAKQALMQATSARLVLATKHGQVSQWTYDVGNLRHLRRAMELSQWTCPGW